MINKMNLVNKLHQDFVVKKIKETDWTNGTSNPLIVELDTTEVCNFSCPGCVSADIIARNNSFSNERLMEIARELYDFGVQAVILIGGGEPLAHPYIDKFITFLAEKNIHIGITTNGSFIRRHFHIIANYSNWTRISMDASTPETFQKLRPTKGGKSYFYQIIEDMRALAQAKKGKLGFSFLIRTEADGFGIETNIHEIYSAALLARNIGCDYFEVKPSYMFDKGVNHSLVKHDLSKMHDAREQIERLDELVTDDFKIILAVNLEYSLNGVDSNQNKYYTKCPIAELRTLICPSGVYVCPYWRGKDKFKIGDIRKTSIKEMWLGEKRKNVMQILNPQVHCSFHCLRHESNLEIYDMLKLIRQGKELCRIREFDKFI